MQDPRKTASVRYVLPIGIGIVVFTLYAGAIRNPLMVDDQRALAGNLLDANEPRLNVLTRPYVDGRGGDPNLYRPAIVTLYNVEQGLRDITHSAMVQFGYDDLAKKVDRNWAPIILRLNNIAMLWLIGWLVAWWFGRYVHPVAAWMAAGLMVVHPVVAATINHVVGRCDLLSLLGIIGFLLAQRRAYAKGAWTPIVALGGMTFALLALGSKESGILLIPASLAQGWLLQAKGEISETKQTPRLHGLTCLLWLVPLGLYLYGRVNAVGWFTPYVGAPDDITGNPLRGLSFAERLPAALAIAGSYARQVFWPHITYVQVPQQLPTWSSPGVWLGVVTLTVVFATLAQTLRRRHWTALPIILAVGHWLLVGNLILPAGVFTSNALTVTLLLPVVALLAAWFNRMIGPTHRHRAHVVLVGLVFALPMAYGVTRANMLSRYPVYRLEYELEKNADNLAIKYRTAEWRLAEADEMTDREKQRSYRLAAVTLLQQILDDRPDSIQARVRLAEAYQQLGEDGMALAEAKIAREQLVEHLLKHKDPRALRLLKQLKKEYPDNTIDESNTWSPSRSDPLFQPMHDPPAN